MSFDSLARLVIKMETQVLHDERNKYSETGGETKHSEARDSCELLEEKTSNEERSIEVKSGCNENPEAEKLCRICHLGPEVSSGGSELIKLGCDCKGELGYSHRICADAWFLQKGNRFCEICDKMAKNVHDNAEDTSIFMMEWNEMRAVAATFDASRERSRRCKQSLYNFLLACLVIAFILPWFIRGMDIF